MKMLAWLLIRDIVLCSLQVKWTRTRMDTSILKSFLGFASKTLHSIYLLTKFVLIHGAPFLKYCWMLTSKQPLKFFNDFGNTLTWNAIITCWNPTSIYYMLHRGLCNSESCSQRVQNSCPILPQLLKLFCFFFQKSVSQWFLGIQHPTQRTNWHL